MNSENNLVFIILSGIPCSGKSTWVEKNIAKLRQKYQCPVIVLSKDVIRAGLGLSSRNHKAREVLVTRIFYNDLSTALTRSRAVIIIDNCNYNERKIDPYLIMLRSFIESGKMKLFIKFFDTSYWTVFWRNIVRYYKIGKYVPTWYIKKTLKEYNKINKENYSKYTYNE